MLLPWANRPLVYTFFYHRVGARFAPLDLFRQNFGQSLGRCSALRP